MKNKTLLIITILFLSIGFAAVSTTLILNGTINVGTNEDDFDVYFSNSFIDGEQNLGVISNDKKTINYETKPLSKVGDKSILEYEVTNASTQYDANVSVTCVPSETDVYKVTNTIDKEIIEARNIGNGVVTVELKKNVLEEQKINFTCTITANAVEREDANTGEIAKSCRELVGNVWEFSYSGKEEEFEIPCDGTYKLEIWGAQGGNTKSIQGVSYIGGYGGYSVGNIILDSKVKLYVNVGGLGSFNGGGHGFGIYSGISHGGDATHISLESGILSTLKNKKDSLLIVSGGGGGSYGYPTRVTSSYSGHGGHAGGFIGNRGNNSGDCYWLGYGGTQNSGGSPVYCSGIDSSYDGGIQVVSNGTFGLGGTASGYGSGGGGGYYGGASSHYAGSGGGSGYIGNPNLTDKIMYCYNCATSTAEATRTETTNQVSPQPEANKAKQGNGHAKITFIG